MSEKLRPNIAKIKLTTDVVTFCIHENTLKVLLIKRPRAPFAGEWALPGGFLWEDESSADAARRILITKAGINKLYMEQLYTFDKPGRDPRGQIASVCYLALVDGEALNIRNTKDIQEPTLHVARNLPELAFDHKRIVTYALERLKAKLEYTNAASALLPESFTFFQLQSIYELVLGKPLDKRNFRKKFLSLGLIKPTGKYLAGGRHRPAELFKFVDSKPVEIARWF